MLKIVGLGLFLVLVLMVPLRASAEVTGFQMNYAVAWGEEDTDCAVEGELTSIVDGQTNGSEAILVNGVEWGSFANGLHTGGFDIGDKFTFGTDSFALKLNYQFDVSLDEDMCADLQDGDEITFHGSSFGAGFGTQLDSFRISPRLNFAYDIQGDGEVDLTTNSVDLTGLSASVTVGEGVPIPGTPGASAASDDCSAIQAEEAGTPSTLWLMLAATALFWVGRRRRLS